MARRLIFNRSSDPDNVLSATTEAGLESDTPEESSVNGQIELFAGGTPSVDENYNVDVLIGGNVGDAEFGFNAVGDTAFNGLCSPWIVDRAYVDIDRNDPINVPHRMLRLISTEAAVIYVAGTALKYCTFSKDSRVWGAVGTVTAADAISAGSTVDAWYFVDTGEAVAFCDGNLFSTFDASTPASWILKGALPATATFGGGATSSHISLVYARDRLVLLFVQSNKVYAAVSYDRGANWSLTVAVSDDFEDAINQADSIHACVSPLDGNIYMVVEDDTNGSGSDDRLRLYRSSDGLEWVQVNSDVGTYLTGSLALKNASITALQDGSFVVFVNVSNTNISAVWVRSDGTQYIPSLGRNNKGSVLTSANLESIEAIDMGHEVVGVSMITDIGGTTLDTLNGLGLRWWSNISEASPYDLMAWLNNQTAEPDSRWGWTANGAAGAATLGNSYLTLDTVQVTLPSRYYNQLLGSDGVEKIKFGAVCVQNCESANRWVGVTVLRMNAASKGFNFGFFIDETGWSLYDFQATAVVSSGSRDFTQYNDFMIDIDFDATNGGASVTVWARFKAEAYPKDYWTRLVTGSVTQSAPFGGEDAEVRFGNYGVAAASHTISRWYYLMVGNAEEGVNASYKNTAADHSDLQGKRCSSLAQEVTNSQSVWWRGAGGIVDDRWTFGSRYLWQKENVLRADPSREWRSSADEALVSVALFEDNNRPFRPDFMAIFGKNFDRFDIEADDASTFDSDAGNPEFSLGVGWGSDVTDDAVGLVVPTSAIELIDEDWVQVNPAHGKSTSLWKGRFDTDSITGRRYWLRVLTGPATGNVYAIESVEMIDDGVSASWQVRLGPDAAGAYPTIVADGVTTSHMVGIFGDAIAVELPPGTFYRLAGYRYVRINIMSQKTWDGFYRIGHMMFGMSAPLGSPIGANSQFVPKIKDVEYDASLGVSPNVSSLQFPDGYVSKRRLGRASRTIDLSWSGIAGLDSWQNAVRSLVEAAHSDTPVAYIDNDDFVHTGPEIPAGTPSRVSYDPILCYVEGSISLAHKTYRLFSPRYGSANQRGIISDIGGIRLREIV